MLIAVFALSAVAASAASAALPEFKPVPTKKKFTSTGGKVVFKEAVGAYEIECSKSATTGEITGASTLSKVVAKFTGCTFNDKGSVCSMRSTNTTTEGEIVTDALKGELGTVPTSQAPSGVGLLLEPETGEDIAWIANSACIGSSPWFGPLAVEVATVGKKQLTNKLVFATRSGDGYIPAIKEITVKSGTVKNPELNYLDIHWGITGTDEIKFEEALEIT